MEYEAFVRRRGRALLRIAFAVTGNWFDAEDLVQIVLLKCYRSWDRIEHADDLDAYVNRMLINANISLHRRLTRRRTAEHAVLDERTVSRALGDRPEDILGRDALWVAIRRLPRRQRVILALRYIDQLSDADIANTLGCAPSTVRAHASRALVVLRRQYQDEAKDGGKQCI